MAKVLETNLTREQIEEMVVCPGWLIIEPVNASGERKTSGGIIVPEKTDYNSALLSLGRVVTCGQFYEKQNGSFEPKCTWPIPRGTMIVWRPQNPWQIRGVDGDTYLVIGSGDVVSAVAN